MLTVSGGVQVELIGRRQPRGRRLFSFQLDHRFGVGRATSVHKLIEPFLAELQASTLARLEATQAAFPNELSHAGNRVAQELGGLFDIQEIAETSKHRRGVVQCFTNHEETGNALPNVRERGNVLL